MPKVHFLPSQKSGDVAFNTKVLLTARHAGVEIRFGCAACRCGTCAVKIIDGAARLSPLKKDEEMLLQKLKLPADGGVRLACQARVMGDCTIDLDFQDQYTAAIGLEDD